LIEEFVLPLFTGSLIEGEEESNPRENEVAQGTNGTILCKPSKPDLYRLIIKREQPFKNLEINLVRAVLEELSKVYRYQIDELAYNRNLQQYALQKAICKSVNVRNYQTLLDLVYELSIWSTKTYEGNKPSFGFLISPRKNLSNNEVAIHFSDIVARDFSVLISDGKNTCINLNGKGNLIGYVNLQNTNNVNTFAPIDFIKIARACKKGIIGLTLMQNGDLLVFSEQQLLFIKSRGSWHCFCHEELIEKLSVGTEVGLKEAIYLSALDVSFAKTGGCICCLRKDQVKNGIKLIDINDILLEEYYNIKLSELDNICDIVENGEETLKPLPDFKSSLSQEQAIKVATLRKIVDGRKFQELDRKLRQELMGIDGATVLDSEGNIVAIGAIIKIEAGSTGGGRLSAAKTLAKYGTSIKISMDSTIHCMTFDAKKQKVKNLFLI